MITWSDAVACIIRTVDYIYGDWWVIHICCILVQQTLETLLESGYDLIREQKLIMETKLSKEYMKNIDD